MRIPFAHVHDLDRQRLIRLHENEIDLQMELNDLADEIAARHERVAVVLGLLEETRRELARLRVEQSA